MADYTLYGCTMYPANYTQWWVHRYEIYQGISGTGTPVSLMFTTIQWFGGTYA